MSTSKTDGKLTADELDAVSGGTMTEQQLVNSIAHRAEALQEFIAIHGSMAAPIMPSAEGAGASPPTMSDGGASLAAAGAAASQGQAGQMQPAPGTGGAVGTAGTAQTGTNPLYGGTKRG